METHEMVRGLETVLKITEDRSIIITITYAEGIGEMRKLSRLLLSGKYAIDVNPKKAPPPGKASTDLKLPEGEKTSANGEDETKTES